MCFEGKFLEYYIFEDLELLGFDFYIKGNKENENILKCFLNEKNYKGLINEDFIIDGLKIIFKNKEVI